MPLGDRQFAIKDNNYIWFQSKHEQSWREKSVIGALRVSAMLQIYPHRSNIFSFAFKVLRMNLILRLFTSTYYDDRLIQTHFPEASFPVDHIRAFAKGCSLTLLNFIHTKRNQ